MKSDSLPDIVPYDRAYEKQVAIDKDYEAASGAPALPEDDSERPVYNYEYRTMDKAPVHHHWIARMVVGGTLTLEEIAAQRQLSIPTVKKILKHQPVKEWVVAQIAQAKLMAAQMRENARAGKTAVADKAFSKLEKVIDGYETVVEDGVEVQIPVKANTALVSAIKMGLDMDPDQRYQPAKGRESSEAPMDTQEINEFSARHNLKVLKAREYSVTNQESVDNGGQLDHNSAQGGGDPAEEG